jgi:hypothetical protein
VQPAFAHWPLVLVPRQGALAVIVVLTWLLCHWAATSGWNDRHGLALVVGALLSHSLFGGAVLAKTMVDRAGVAVLILGGSQGLWARGYEGTSETSERLEGRTP